MEEPMESSVEKHSDHSSDSHPSCPSEHKVRARAMLTSEQYTALSALWAETQFPTTHQRVELAERISMRPRTVQIWFQNQRQKSKRQSILQAESVSGSAHHISTNNERAYSTHLTHPSHPPPPPIYGTYSYHHSVTAPGPPHHLTSASPCHSVSSTPVYNPSGHVFPSSAEPGLLPPLPPVRSSVMAPPVSIDVVVRPSDGNPSYLQTTGVAPPLPPFDTKAQWDSSTGKTTWPAEHSIHHPVPSSSFPVGNPSMTYRSRSTHPYPPWGPSSPVRRQSLGHYHPYGNTIGHTVHPIRHSPSEPAKPQLMHRADMVSTSASPLFPTISTSYPAASTSLVPMSASPSESTPEVPAFKSSTTTSLTTTTTTTVLNPNTVNQSPASMKLPSFREFLQSTVSPPAHLPDQIQPSPTESEEHVPPSSSTSPSSASFAPPIPIPDRMYPTTFGHSFQSIPRYASRRSA